MGLGSVGGPFSPVSLVLSCVVLQPITIIVIVSITINTCVGGCIYIIATSTLAI